jgi:hypothetical protein
VTTKRRLDQLEGGLSPQEAVLRWLAEVHEHATLPDYVQSLVGQPSSAFPLYRIPDEIEQSVRGSVKGDKQTVDRAILEAVREGAFLVYLVTGSNSHVLQSQQACWFNFLLVSKGLKAFLKRSEAWEGREQRSWCRMAETLVTTVFAISGAVEQIATTYFRGRTPLFPATAEDLERLEAATLGISESYHRSLETGLLGAKAKAKRFKPPIDLNQIREEAKDLARERAQQIITLAQAEALSMTGEHQRGLELVEARIFL